MKKLLLSAVLVASLGAVAVANAANTSTGTITINGQIVSSTCNVAINDSNNPTITLPTYDTGALATAGAATGWTAFTMVLSGCTAVTGVPTPGTNPTKVFPYFTGTNIDTTTGYLKNTITSGSGGSNVEIALSNGQTATAGATGALALAAASGSQNVTAQLLSGNPSFTFYAGYVANGAAATAGAVSTTVQYALNYQ